MLYRVTVETLPGREMIGELGDFFRREKAEAVAKKESRDLGPNLLVSVVTHREDGSVKSRKGYRYGRVFSLRRT